MQPNHGSFAGLYSWFMTITFFFVTVAMQALAAIPSINSEAVQHKLDRVRTYYELLNMPFEASHCNLLHFLLQHFLFVLDVNSIFAFAGLACLHYRARAPVYGCRVSQTTIILTIILSISIIGD